MKIFVVGDSGWDNYLVGKVRGISAESPIPILDIQPPTLLPGMARNVVDNLRALGAEAELIIAEGTNEPIKSRVMTEDGQQVARFDLNDYCAPLQRADLLPLIDADAVIVSDYGKGAITDDVTSILAGVSAPLFVDTKGDPSPWLQSNAILFPNQQEWTKYRAKYEWFPRVVLKQGPDGLSYVEYGKVVTTRPAWAKRVGSVNGAGDTVIAAFAVAFMLFDGDIHRSLDVGAAAAALVVEQEFLQRTTTPEEIGKRIQDEVPEKVYNPFQTQYSNPYTVAPSAYRGNGLSPAQSRTATEYAGQSPQYVEGLGGADCSVLATALRNLRDFWEDDSWAV